MKDFEYKDIKSVEDLFRNYTPTRIRFMLRFREPREIARLALNRTFRRDSQAIAALIDYFNREDIPETEPPECNCEPANGLRWDNLPVSWSYSPFRQDIPNTARLIRENWAQIEAVCGFKAVETAEVTANIAINNAPLDGRGGTLGQAYQPASGERMAACGRMCGDITIDSDEIWTEEYLKTVLLHEQLHAIGLAHSNDRRSIMYPRYQGPRGLHDVDIAELLRRYPLRPVT